MSRAIMLSEYGGEPVILAQHDILFEIINTRITNDDLRNKQELTSWLTLAVNSRLAAHLAQHGLIAGLRLFKFHKHMLCRYADAQLRAKGKGHARPAIQEFLNLYGVEEDEYSLDSAYKLFQRFLWEIQRKNSVFFERLRRKPGAVLFEKKKAAEGNAPPPDISAEIAVGKFMSAVNILMKRTNRRLEKQVRTYIYIYEIGLTYREVADMTGVPLGSVHYSCSAMRRRMERNPIYSRLLADALALPAATV